MTTIPDVENASYEDLDQYVGALMCVTNFIASGCQVVESLWALEHLGHANDEIIARAKVALDEIGRRRDKAEAMMGGGDGKAN